MSRRLCESCPPAPRSPASMPASSAARCILRERSPSPPAIKTSRTTCSKAIFKSSMSRTWAGCLGMRWTGGALSGNGNLELSGYTDADLASSAKGDLHFECGQGSISNAKSAVAGGATKSQPIPAALARFDRWSADAAIADGAIQLGQNSVICRCPQALRRSHHHLRRPAAGQLSRPKAGATPRNTSRIRFNLRSTYGPYRPLLLSAISCKAILFDMDGILISSIGSVERSWTKWAHSARRRSRAGACRPLTGGEPSRPSPNFAPTSTATRS